MTVRYMTLPQLGRRVPVGETQTILQAALAAGIGYPHSCASGRCGACRSRLLSGTVELGKHSPFALSEQDRAEGLILACRAIPRDDVAVAWLDEDYVAASPSAGDARVVATERMTHDIVAIRLELGERDTFRFAAGQYLSLKLPDAPPRHYSMASRPDDRLVELHVRAVPGGRVSGMLHSSLLPGDTVRIEGPLGSAYLREAHTGPIVAIAGGSGLAPIKSIVETALVTGMRQSIAVYFGVRGERDLYLVDHFRELEANFANLTFVPVLSEGGVAGLRQGLVTDAVAADHRMLAAAKAYVAGPPAMVAAAMTLLGARGIPATDIHADVFFTTEGGDDSVA